MAIVAKLSSFSTHNASIVIHSFRFACPSRHRERRGEGWMLAAGSQHAVLVTCFARRGSGYRARKASMIDGARSGRLQLLVLNMRDFRPQLHADHEPVRTHHDCRRHKLRIPPEALAKSNHRPARHRSLSQHPHADPTMAERSQFETVTGQQATPATTSGWRHLETSTFFCDCHLTTVSET